MKKVLMRQALLLGFFFPCILVAQPNGFVNEAGDFIAYEETTPTSTPRDGAFDREVVTQKLPISYPHVEERDVLMSRKIWREVHLNELMNQYFKYPDEPLFNIMRDLAKAGDITLYSNVDDKFSTPLSQAEAEELWGSVDTIIVYDPETFEETVEVVTNEISYLDIKKFRIKEEWFFDAKYGRMQVRILGIAPVLEKTTDAGYYLYEYPLFWMYYPDARNSLAQHQAYNPFNDAATFSWEDMLELRYFSSIVYKASNVQDRRLKDYLDGVPMLIESERIEEELFNYEHDLWSY